MYRSLCKFSNINFILNLTQGVFIDIIYHIETLNFNAATLVTSVSHKIATKMRYSMSKDTAFDGETTLRQTFLCSDPRILITFCKLSIIN